MTQASALDGIRVVDLSPTRVGAQASQTLADFGADVVWVEPPGGSALRGEAAFPFLARGKRSEIADLRSAAGVQRVLDLTAGADVLIETFRPGVAERLGLGYEALCACNPGLVYTSITGFGREGPWAHLKAYEGIVAAVLGLQASFARMHGGANPPFVSVSFCSYAASQTALHGILTALLERERSGHGQRVEANLAQGLATLDPWAWFEYLVTERWPDAFKPAEPADEKGVPNSHMTFLLPTLQTKDGRWLQFAQNAPRLFVAMMHALGLGDLLDDPEWKDLPLVEDHDRRADLWDRMLVAGSDKTLAEWDDVFASDHDVFAELYRRGPEVLDHPQLVGTGLVVELDDPERGRVRQPGPIVRLSATPAVLRAAPVLGAGAPAGTGDWSPRPSRPRAPAHRGLPLDGITILEFATLFAAPYGATLLTDLGARVIKVEPLTGDPVRNMPGFPETGAKAIQGKDCIAVDVATPEGREIVHTLAAQADAVLEGYRDGVAERLGIDVATLQRINPELVYLSAHGYGVGGPYADRPAFAPSIGAAGGIAAANLGDTVPHGSCASLDEMRLQSVRIRAGATSRYAQSDGIAALSVATSLLLGLLARARGAGGQHLWTSMVLSTAHALADHVVDFPDSPGGPTPGPGMRGPSALYGVYDAADGWVFLAAPRPEEWDALVAVMAPFCHLGADPRFATPESRRTDDTALRSALADAFALRGKDEWERDLGAADVACVAVLSGFNEPVLMSEEQGRASGYIADVVHPTFDLHPRLAPVVRFSRSGTQAKPAGLCGAATDAVLAELGYTSERIAALRARKVIL